MTNLLVVLRELDLKVSAFTSCAAQSATTQITGESKDRLRQL